MNFLRSWRQFPRLLRRSRNASDSAARPQGPEMPNGFLFNEKPLLPGEKRVKEFWENTWVYGMGFNFFLLFIVAVFSPDTSMESWAREKAVERLEEKDRIKAIKKAAAAAILAGETGEVVAFKGNSES